MQRKYQKTKIGKLLRKQRKKLKLSVNQCLQALDLHSRQMLNYVENGRIRLLKSDTFERISEFYQINPEILRNLRPQRKPYSKERKNSVGAFLTKKRMRIHLTQEKVAERAGLSTATISVTEQGKHLRLSTLSKIAGALECKIPAKLLRAKQKKKITLDPPV